MLLQITYSSFEYWKLFNDKEELIKAETECEYPPRFHIECFRKVPNKELHSSFSVAKMKMEQPKVLAEFLLIKQTTGVCKYNEVTS